MNFRTVNIDILVVSGLIKIIKKTVRSFFIVR